MRQGDEFQSTTRGEPSSPSSILRRALGDGHGEELIPTVDAVGRGSRPWSAVSRTVDHTPMEAEGRDAPSDTRHTSSLSKVHYDRKNEASPWFVDEREESVSQLREDTSEERMDFAEERCPHSDHGEPDTKATHRPHQPLEDSHWEEQRSDIEASHRQDSSSREERETIPSDDHFDCNDEIEYHLQLLNRDEEEARMRLELEEELLRDEEERVLSVLDELLQIHDEEYPNQQNEQGSAQPQEEATGVRWEINEDDDNNDLDRLLLQEGTPLSNDSQMEELVAMCDRRDRDLDNRIPSRSDNNGQDRTTGAGTTAAAACVVCLEAPRTHAYVPCGHFCVCFSCAKQQLTQRSIHASCPVCQQPCTKVMRIFIP